ncbi:phenylacetate--CoA ligase [Solirubrobacter phytolaccae]|uniref:Phenylacetate-coenzyme A ligase n=1 Tax=Solirubrobacter phytolaccae TaxID=1404360 RepID=A0A9X3SEK6_9ACTN|nr:phenylacetate--CoA ligase [Solirubrobacter phytolaccae]MDA0185000.1 phenylacetate--CoA ligase [Solirubrobacter phytolaccae]
MTAPTVTFDSAELAPRERLAEVQLARLRATLARRGLDIPITTLEDLRAVPFTTKDDLRARYPLGMETVPPEEIVRLHSSSGTSGTPTIVGHTAKDLDTWAFLVARLLAMAGVRPGMVVHNAYPYGLTTGGFGFQQGAERLGATVVPAAGAPLDVQARLLRDLETPVLLCAPSFAAQLADTLGTHSIEVGLFGGEMWTPVLRDRLERQLGIIALDTYGMSELCGPGVAGECIEGRDGAHIMEDHFLAEVIDPVTTEPVAPGEYGELVLTTLTREAMPLVRYRTGDITALIDEPCVCGRTFARMASVVGRRTDVIEAGGARVYPSEIERVLLAHPGIGLNYQLVVEGDHLDVHCESVDGFGDRVHLAAELRAALGVDADVIVDAPGGVPRSPGKAVRVVRR